MPRQLKCQNTLNWGSTLKLEGCLTQPDKLYWKTKKKNLLGGKSETKVIRASSSGKQKRPFRREK